MSHGYDSTSTIEVTIYPIDMQKIFIWNKNLQQASVIIVCYGNCNPWLWMTPGVSDLMHSFVLDIVRSSHLCYSAMHQLFWLLCKRPQHIRYEFKQNSSIKFWSVKITWTGGVLNTHCNDSNDNKMITCSSAGCCMCLMKTWPEQDAIIYYKIFQE